MQERNIEIDQLYELLDRQSEKLRARYDHSLTPTVFPTSRRGWGTKGVYFFFEPDEQRGFNVDAQRVVRIGSHSGGKSSIESRIVQEHAKDWGRSIFRRHVGASLIRRGDFDIEIKQVDEVKQVDRDRWANLWSARRNGRGVHHLLESLDPALHSLHAIVTETIKNMNIVWIEIPDRNARLDFEKECIQLLSNYNNASDPIDSPSKDWLGRFSLNEEVQRSGLWNVQHVKRPHRSGFLQDFEKYFF